MPSVSIARCSPAGDHVAVRAAVERAISVACDLREIVRPGKTVVLKPNVFAPRPAPTTTDPRVVVAVGELCREAGAGRVIVAEGRSISTAKYRKGANSTRQCFEAVGMSQAVEAAGFEVVYLEDDEFVEVEVPGAQVLHTAHVPRTILEADVFVNLPVMKIHSLTLVTLAIKNLHGIISDYDKLYRHCYRELALARKLTDILRIRRIDLNVMDALVAQEADHAADGRPARRRSGTIAWTQATLASSSHDMSRTMQSSERETSWSAIPWPRPCWRTFDGPRVGSVSICLTDREGGLIRRSSRRFGA